MQVDEIKMMQENEIISLMLGISILILIFINRLKVKQLLFSGIFLSGFYFLLIGIVLTVLEGFFLPDILNLLEHACYSISSVFLLIWCWKVFKQNTGDES